MNTGTVNITVTIDDKTYTYGLHDTWDIEVGRYRGAYRLQYRMTTVVDGVKYYRCINIGNGYKKRLVLRRADGTRTVVARYIS